MTPTAFQHILKGATMTIQMFDTTTPDEVPTGNVQAVAGYVGGYWPTYARLVQDHPQAHHLSIAVNAKRRG